MANVGDEVDPSSERSMIYQYGQKEYWDDRYRKLKKSSAQEWFLGYGELAGMMNSSYFSTSSAVSFSRPLDFNSSSLPLYFPRKHKTRVLILGCGNSTFGEEMLLDGWTGKIVQVDFSGVVMKQMRERFKNTCSSSLSLPSGGQMEFVEADMTKPLPFDDQSFDLVIMKASLDIVLSGPTSKYGATCAVRECARILARSHGILMLVTSGNTENRLEYLECQHRLDYFWQGVCVHAFSYLPQSLSRSGLSERKCYVYICRKHSFHTERVPGDKENTVASKEHLFGLKSE